MRIFQTLSSGSTGVEVQLLQRTLPAWSWDSNPPDLDGQYGPKTAGAVRKYQDQKGLKADGVAGKDTLASLGLWSEVLHGVDLSGYQKNIDWDQVARSGKVDFVIVKASEGQTHQSPGFESHYQGARSIGAKVGAYHFVRMDGNDPWDEVQNCLNVIGGRALDLPIWADVEFNQELPPKEALSWLHAWLHEVERLTGVKPGIYTNNRQVEPYLAGGEGLEHYKVWWPRWGSQPVSVLPWDNWHIWQYSAQGTIPGIPGDVDVNWMVKP